MLYIFKNYDELSCKAASIVSSQVILKPNSVLGLATGATPLGMYQKLKKIYEKGIVDFSNVVTFNIDEYLDLDYKNPNSYHYYMYNNFFNYINIQQENINFPPQVNGKVGDLYQEYDKRIEDKGGIDLQILGIGINGHIGFNEPNQELITCTHITKLSEDTINVNNGFFSRKDEMPNRAISLGIGSIIKAKNILLLASGKSKANIIAKIFNNKITTSNPSSFLKLHPNITTILDEDAAKFVS